MHWSIRFHWGQMTGPAKRLWEQPVSSFRRVIRLSICRAYEEYVEISLGSHDRVSMIQMTQSSPYNAEPSENQVDNIVDCFDSQNRFASKTVARTQNLSDVSDGIRRGEEWSIQPTPTLRDELRQCIRYVGLSNSTFDVFEDPRCIVRNRTHALTRVRTRHSGPLQLVQNIGYAFDSIRRWGVGSCKSHSYIFGKVYGSMSSWAFVTQRRYLHIFEVKMSVSRPCRISPLKYDASGPTPLSSFWRAMYLYSYNQAEIDFMLECTLPISRKRSRLRMDHVNFCCRQEWFHGVPAH